MWLARVEQQDGQEIAVFRFQAPKDRFAKVGTPRTVSPGATNEKPIQPAWDSAVIVPTGGGEIRVLPPVDPVWRLRCDVAIQGPSPKGLVEKLWWSWRQKSLSPLRWIAVSDFHGKLILDSELITNAVARTIEIPGR